MKMEFDFTRKKFSNGKVQYALKYTGEKMPEEVYKAYLDIMKDGAKPFGIDLHLGFGEWYARKGVGDAEMPKFVDALRKLGATVNEVEPKTKTKIVHTLDELGKLDW